MTPVVVTPMMKPWLAVFCMLAIAAPSVPALAQQDDSRFGQEQDYRGTLILRFPFTTKGEKPAPPEFGVNLENRRPERDGYTIDRYDRDLGMRLPQDDVGGIRTFPLEFPEFKLDDPRIGELEG